MTESMIDRAKTILFWVPFVLIFTGMIGVLATMGWLVWSEFLSEERSYVAWLGFLSAQALFIGFIALVPSVPPPFMMHPPPPPFESK